LSELVHSGLRDLMGFPSARLAKDTGLAEVFPKFWAK